MKVHGLTPAIIREALDNGTFQQFHDTYVHKLDTRI